MIVKDVETVLIVSAVLAKVPLVDRLEKDPFEIIRSGDWVKVNADEGTVSVRRDK
jgi:predicted aconitase with swiveling domain